MRTALIGALTLAYPLLIYFGLAHFEIHWLALMLAGIALLRAATSRDRASLLAACAALGLAAATGLTDQSLPLKCYPVVVNAAFLAVFMHSLFHPPSAIERLARLAEPNLPAEAIPYTRRVTQVWCAFFAINGGVAIATALWASDAVWALYNGGIAYGLMGLLFVGEWCLRRRIRSIGPHG